MQHGLAALIETLLPGDFAAGNEDALRTVEQAHPAGAIPTHDLLP
jgi:hypothetical protein